MGSKIELNRNQIFSNFKNSGKERLIFLREGDKDFDEAQKIVRGRRKLLLKIIPEKIELLDYDFIKKGYSRLQFLEF